MYILSCLGLLLLSLASSPGHSHVFKGTTLIVTVLIVKAIFLGDIELARQVTTTYLRNSRVQLLVWIVAIYYQVAIICLIFTASASVPPREVCELVTVTLYYWSIEEQIQA